MWIEVTNRNASATAIAAAAASEEPPKTGSSSFASEGSPRKPIPIEHRVMPTWQAAMYSERCSTWSSACSAPR